MLCQIVRRFLSMVAAALASLRWMMEETWKKTGRGGAKLTPVIAPTPASVTPVIAPAPTPMVDPPAATTAGLARSTSESSSSSCWAIPSPMGTNCKVVKRKQLKRGTQKRANSVPTRDHR